MEGFEEICAQRCNHEKLLARPFARSHDAAENGAFRYMFNSADAGDAVCKRPCP